MERKDARYGWNTANRLKAIPAPDGTLHHYRYNAASSIGHRSSNGG